MMQKNLKTHINKSKTLRILMKADKFIVAASTSHPRHMHLSLDDLTRAAMLVEGVEEIEVSP
jgi:hypothetical protein